MKIPKIITRQSPNYGYPRGTKGRNGHSIAGVILHIFGGENEDYILRADAKASYNRVIRRDGTIVVFVPDGNAAWAHGDVQGATWPLLKPGVNPNLYALSLCRLGSNQNLWTPEQMESTLWQLRDWSQRYGFPLRRPYIGGHFEINASGRWYCPGRPFFDEVIRQLEIPPPEPEPSTAYNPGDWFVTTAEPWLNLRDNPNGGTVAQLISGSRGRVVRHARNGVYEGGYHWWHVIVDRIGRGWIAEGYFELINSPPRPEPQIHHDDFVPGVKDD